MKKVYSNKFIIYISIFGIVFFSITAIVCIFSIIFNVLNEKINMVIVNSALLFEFACFIAFFFFILNRLGYQVLYNMDERMIIRRGFIFGYKYQLKIEDVNDIIITTFPKETTYYVIIDSVNTKYDGGLKKSFIRIEKNEKNYKFIKQFWNKPIKEYKEYVDFFK